jgi:predicted DNA-binding WGR domain protein
MSRDTAPAESSIGTVCSESVTRSFSGARARTKRDKACPEARAIAARPAGTVEHAGVPTCDAHSYRVGEAPRDGPTRNVHQFYRMENMPGLFGEWSLVREWGRIGQPGQVRDDWNDTEAAANEARFDILMKKAKRGCEEQGAWPDD